MRYSMNIKFSSATLESTAALEERSAKLGIVVNDIHSFDEELRA